VGFAGRDLFGCGVRGDDAAGAASELKGLHAVVLADCCEGDLVAVVKPGAMFAV